MTAPHRTDDLLLKCNNCGVVVHESMDSRSYIDRCGLVYSPQSSPGQFYPCEGRLIPVVGAPVNDLEALVQERDELRARVRQAEQERDRLLDVLDDFAHAAHKVLEGDSYIGTTPEMVAAARHRLAVFAGKYDRPVTALGASAPPEPR